MTANYADLYNPNRTPQSEPADDRQVPNSAGGYVFQIDCWARLDRFLILGSDAPTYYQSARELTRENARVVEECWATDPTRTAQHIAHISETARAPRNDAAIFALALGAVHRDVAVRRAALAQLRRVCRTATHLFQFVSTARKLGRGWGRAFRRAVQEWYEALPTEAVAYQAIKYRSRAGYTHRRLLQTAHPPGMRDRPVRESLYRWIVGREVNPDDLPPIVGAHLRAMAATRSRDLVPLIEEHHLPWEALPTWALNDPDIWRAMAPKLGLTAVLRELGRMTSIGALAPMSETERTVAARLADPQELWRARVHPFAILQAMAVYRGGSARAAATQGREARTWTPSRPVLDALDAAFYASFQNVRTTEKRWLLALDVSGSMTKEIMGSALSCRAAAAAMSLVTMATEPSTHVVGFTSGRRRSSHSMRIIRPAAITPLEISSRQRLDDVVRYTAELYFGRTDCALPMLYALEHGLEVDVFAVYTDNETWAGHIHPHRALQRYRKETGIPAKLVVIGMTSTGFSIADPDDGGMMDVVGFDASAPAVMSDFVGS